MVWLAVLSALVAYAGFVLLVAKSMAIGMGTHARSPHPAYAIAEGVNPSPARSATLHRYADIKLVWDVSQTRGQQAAR